LRIRAACGRGRDGEVEQGGGEKARESGGVNEGEAIAHSGGPVIDSHHTSATTAFGSPGLFPLGRSVSSRSFADRSRIEIASAASARCEEGEGREKRAPTCRVTYGLT